VEALQTYDHNFVDIIPHHDRFTGGYTTKNSWQAFFNIVGRQSTFLTTKNYFIMSGLLYLIAVILLIGWLLGVFVYSVGGLIHILIVLALISLILGIIRRA
jgi:Family of unknown function (DUF5670)